MEVAKPYLSVRVDVPGRIVCTWCMCVPFPDPRAIVRTPHQQIGGHGLMRRPALGTIRKL